jgi:hypothetical protein
MGNQNAKSICQTWNIFSGIDDVKPSKEIDLHELGTKQQN